MSWADELRDRASAFGFSPAVQRFYFLRHGETAENRARIIQGQADVPLNDDGLSQAKRASTILSDHPVTRIVASDLQRVTMTVAPLVETNALALAADPGLRERGFGDLQGQPIPENLWAHTGNGVEPIDTFVDRILSTLTDMLAEEALLIGSHGGVLRVIANALPLPVSNWAYVNALPLRFDRSEDSWTVRALVDEGDGFDACGSLPEPLQSWGGQPTFHKPVGEIA